MNNKGFTLIELLFAIALSALFLPAMVFVFSFSLGAASQGESYTQAYSIAQEYMEAIFYLKDNASSDWDWDNNTQLTSNSEYYQPSNLSGNWMLGGKTSSPTSTNGYETIVQIFKTCRDDIDGDEILDIYPSDPDNTCVYDDDLTRKVVVKVTWNEKGEDTSIDLVSYVTKH